MAAAATFSTLMLGSLQHSTPPLSFITHSHRRRLDIIAAYRVRFSTRLWKSSAWSDFGTGPVQSCQNILTHVRPRKELHLSPEGDIDTKFPAQEEMPTTDRGNYSENTDEKVSSKFLNNPDGYGDSEVDGILPKLDAAITEAAEIVVETVEVAAQTVSSVGELASPVSEGVSIDQAAAAKTVIFWVCAAVSCGLAIGMKDGTAKASEFFAGYLLEQSLSVDNLFVFVLIFKYFQVPTAYQGRVLTYGLSGAILLRATMILLGVATIQRFEAVNLIFAGILIFTSYKLLTETEEGDEEFSDNFIVGICRKFIPVSAAYDGNKFFTTVEGVKKATPLLLTLAVVELSDVAFAVDSIPAVFGVTRDPFIVFSSNIFAIVGLRSLYTLISSSMGELRFLQPAIATILGFVGLKMVLEFFGIHLATELSLAIVALVLGTGVGLSLLKMEEDD